MEKELLETLRVWEEIDLDALRYNFSALRKHLPERVKLCAVIKADAYGHGAVEAAQALNGMADYFAVAAPEEALLLRRRGVKTPLLLLGPVPPGTYGPLIEAEAELCVASFSEGEAIAKIAQKLKKQAKVHIALDTGMGRIGFPCTEKALEETEALSRLPYLTLQGIFSHYALADSFDKSFAIEQTRRFSAFTETLQKRGVSIPLRHLCNSAGGIEMPDKFDMVREGIILYGLKPSNEVDLSLIGGIKPALSLRCRVTEIKTLSPGDSVSYGRTFIAKGGERVATLSAGYADGVPRLLSNRGEVLLHGKRAPIIGRVCMDQMMAEVSAVPELKIGDTATIIGDDGPNSITADDVADICSTIGYEIVCLVPDRVPRLYRESGKVVKRRLPLDG